MKTDPSKKIITDFSAGENRAIFNFNRSSHTAFLSYYPPSYKPGADNSGTGLYATLTIYDSVIIEKLAQKIRTKLIYKGTVSTKSPCPVFPGQTNIWISHDPRSSPEIRDFVMDSLLTILSKLPKNSSISAIKLGTNPYLLSQDWVAERGLKYDEKNGLITMTKSTKIPNQNRFKLLDLV
jgi:hypothetical protein